MACPFQHAPEELRSPRSTNRAIGTTNAATTQKVAHPVQQAPPKHVSYYGNNGQNWTVIEKEKRNIAFGTGCGSDRVQGAPPPSRNLVIERVPKVTFLYTCVSLKDAFLHHALCVI